MVLSLVLTTARLPSVTAPDVRSVPYATRFGGSAYDMIADVAVDAHGNVYVTGGTRSADFPLRNPLQSGIGGAAGKSTAFIAKLAPTGALIFSTFFGGSGSDFGHRIAVADSGAVIVVGGTSSRNLPTTTGVIQPAPACPNGVPWCNDTFLVKLEPTGRLVMATYFGHGNTDVPRLALDASGSIYLAGTARERIDEQGQPVPGPVSGGYHGFVVKLSSDAARYTYVKHIEPSGTSNVHGLAVDAAGRAYVAGRDSACRVQATPGAFATAKGCLFVAKLTANDGSVEWLSRFGGTDVVDINPDIEETHITDVAVDALSFVYVTGVTSSRDFPVTPDAAQPALRVNANGPSYRNVDAFVTKLRPDGSGLAYSTYLGGSDAEYPTGIGIDARGYAYVAGTTESDDLGGYAYEISRAAGALLCCWDAFAAVLNSDGSVLLNLSVVGSRFSDLASGIAVGPQHDVWLAGYTFSPEFPTTPDALDRTAREEADGIVVRLPAVPAPLRTAAQ